jgi:cobyrinic acid a,c-diamide synthase
MKKFLIAAASSGSGKTTFTIGLLRRLRNMGLKVQPFKCGPDYIDTKWHTLAAGSESVNLDLWMSSKEHVKEVFERYGGDADVCVVEGVMGLFDGWDKSAGSCAEIAKLCGLPVVLLVNAKSTAYSVAPLIYGFKNFDPEIELAGVVLNQVASESHYDHLRQACEDAGVKCLGYMKRCKDIELPSRHLGLSIDEKLRIDSFIDKVEKQIYIEEMRSEEMRSENVPLPCGGVRGGLLISVAQDEAFNFTYRANIDALKDMGHVRFFSPITDNGIPEGTDLLYLPGGYPEFFLKELSANKSMLKSVRDYIEGGGRCYAECGGMLYLCRNIIGMDGKSYGMADVLSLEATFENMRLHLGYRNIDAEGIALKGHEFHYSEVRPVNDGEKNIGKALNAKGQPTDTALYRHKNLIAGYTHLYWGETNIFHILFNDFQ